MLLQQPKSYPGFGPVQSVARHVGRDLPNIWTPFSMSLMMMALDSLNSDSSSSVKFQVSSFFLFHS